jgi:hypothetical protein
MGIKLVAWVVITLATLMMMTVHGPLQPLLYFLINRPLKWNPVSDKELESPTILAAEGTARQRILDMDLDMPLYIGQGVPEAQLKPSVRAHPTRVWKGLAPTPMAGRGVCAAAKIRVDPLVQSSHAAGVCIAGPPGAGRWKLSLDAAAGERLRLVIRTAPLAWHSK